MKTHPEHVLRANRACRRCDHCCLAGSATLPEGTPARGLEGYKGACPSKQRKLCVVRPRDRRGPDNAATGDFTGAGAENVRRQ